MSSSTRSAKRRVAEAALALVCLTDAAEAAGPGGFDDAPVPTVITATRIEQSVLDAPMAVTVIDSNWIRSSGAREIPDLLRQVPGLIVARDSGAGVFVSQHGYAPEQARRMQVLIDGRSVLGPGLARVDWVSLPVEIEDIERIEVVRGPNSATYGANSFLGVINIITRHPQDLPISEVRLRAGTRGVNDAMGRLSLHGLGGDWAWTAFHRESDGSDFNAKRPSRPFRDDYRVDGLTGKGAWYLPADGQLTLNLGYSRLEAEQPRTYDPSLFTQVPVAEVGNRFANLSLQQPLGANHLLGFTTSVTDTRRDEPWRLSLPYLAFSPEANALYDNDPALANQFMDDPVGTCGSPSAVRNPRLAAVCLRAIQPEYTTPREYRTNPSFSERRVDAELSDTWQILPGLRSILGGRLSESMAESQTYLGGRQTASLGSLFTHIEWRPASQWLFNTGASLEHDSLSRTELSPRAALSWQPVPWQSFRIGYSQAVRTPDIFEQRAVWSYQGTTVDRSQSRYDGTFFQKAMSPGNAPTERITTREVAWLARHAPTGLDADVRFFHNHLLLNDPNLRIENFQLGELERFELMGAEAAAGWQISGRQRFQVHYARLDLAGPRNDNRLYTPTQSGGGGWYWLDPDGWRASAVYGFYHYLYIQAQGGLHYDRLDLHLGRSLRLGGGHLLDVGLTAQMRLTRDVELRTDNGENSQNRLWATIGWRR